MINRVLNKRYVEVITNDMVYIGRKSGGLNSFEHFGNPFSHENVSLARVWVPTREISITLFESWIRGESHLDVEPERRLWILENLHKLSGKDLVCWCSPLPCHGEVYIKLLKEVGL